VLVDPALAATNRDSNKKLGKLGKFCSICQRLGRTFSASTHNDDEHLGYKELMKKNAAKSNRSVDKVHMKSVPVRVAREKSLTANTSTEQVVDAVPNVTKPLTARR
jgi:hypothetical protein